MSAESVLLARGIYAAPNSKDVLSHTTLDSLLSDDFGSSVGSLPNWTIIDGGLGANPNLGQGMLTQAAIGSGTLMGNGAIDFTNTALSIAASALTVAMGTTNGAELWLLSTQVFAGKEDIWITLSKSQSLAANSILISLVEVDPVTLCPILNPNLANEFTNRGGVELGLTATNTAYQAEAIGDSSPAKAVGSIGGYNGGFGPANMASNTEFLIEIDARDIFVSPSGPDSIIGKGTVPSRVSTQVPNDKKLYKLIMRFRNVSAPGSSTSVVIQRVLVVDNYELRAQISSGEGDQIAGKALAVNNLNSSVFPNPAGGTGVATTHKLISAASTNATSVKAAKGTIGGGSVTNTAASTRYFKFYNKASAPVVGTDTPTFTITVLANGIVNLADFVGAYGYQMTTGIAYAITGGQADADATAIAAGDVVVNLLYT